MLDEVSKRLLLELNTSVYFHNDLKRKKEEEEKKLLKRLKDEESYSDDFPHGEYVVYDENSYVLDKIKNKDKYGREIPVIELEPLMDSVPLKRDYMDFGIRGYWFVGDPQSYRSDTYVDGYRVKYHEDVHRRLTRTNPNHPESDVRMLEMWRLGEEK